jgi:hypothetical protein
MSVYYRNTEIPVEELQRKIEYKDGKLYWKYCKDRSNKWNETFVGTEIKTFESNRYRRFAINYKGKEHKLRVHIVVWAIMKGKYPDICIDHINNIRSDNRIENLREANHCQNSLNRPPIKTATSQYKGVFWDKKNRKWRVQQQLNKVTYHTDRFIDELEAALAYNEAAKKMQDSEFIYINDISMGYTNQEYPNMPRGWKPEQLAA